MQKSPPDAETTDEEAQNPEPSSTIVIAPKSASDFFDGESPLKSNSSTHANPASIEPQALIPNRSPTISSTTESLDGRLVHIEQLEPEILEPENL